MPAWHSHKGIISALVVLALLVIAVLDWATGTDFGFFVFYFVPISLAAWGFGRAGGALTAVSAALLWARIEAPEMLQLESQVRFYWNTGIHLLAFLVIGIAVARIRHLLERERQLNTELSEALANVKQLRGLLPICGSCKKIRNDKGYWERLESYIEKYSDAEFSHGICPECLERLYRKLDLEEGEGSGRPAPPVDP